MVKFCLRLLNDLYFKFSRKIVELLLCSTLNVLLHKLEAGFDSCTSSRHAIPDPDQWIMGVLTFLSKISGAMEYICEKSDYKFFPGLNWFMSANHWPQNAVCPSLGRVGDSRGSPS